MIGFTNTGFAPVNINRAKSDGLELSYDAAFGDTSLRASATTQNPVDESTGERLLRRAKRFASISVGHQLGQWNIGGEVVASGSKEDIRVDDFSTRVQVAGYTLFNLKTTYNLAKHMRLTGRLDNLFDKKYQLAHGYHREGRSGYFDITYEF